MHRSPRARYRLAVEAVKAGVVVTLSTMAILSGTAPQYTADSSQLTAPETEPAPDQARLDRLVERFECSAQGFAPDVIPGSSLVQRGSTIEHVSFDDGWAVYQGDAPGTLLAVCLARL